MWCGGRKLADRFAITGDGRGGSGHPPGRGVISVRTLSTYAITIEPGVSTMKIRQLGSLAVIASLILIAIDSPWSFAASGVFALLGIGLRIEAAIVDGGKPKAPERPTRLTQRSDALGDHHY